MSYRSIWEMTGSEKVVLTIEVNILNTLFILKVGVRSLRAGVELLYVLSYEQVC